MGLIFIIYTFFENFSLSFNEINAYQAQNTLQRGCFGNILYGNRLTGRCALRAIDITLDYALAFGLRATLALPLAALFERKTLRLGHENKQACFRDARLTSL